MVDIEKAVIAIEEKRKWETREQEILDELKKVRSRRKKLKEKAKKLKEKINESASAIQSRQNQKRSIPDPTMNLIEEIKRI